MLEKILRFGKGGGSEKQVAGERVERMPIAYFSDGWFEGKWDYVDNETVYWLAVGEETGQPVVSGSACTTFTPGFFSMGGAMFDDDAFRQPIPDSIAADLSASTLAAWIAETFTEWKRFGEEKTREECIPFDARDWLVLLNEPAIERWNRKRLTGSAGGPPSLAERASALGRFAREIGGLRGVKAKPVIVNGDIWDDGAWEADKVELDSRFGGGWSFYRGMRQGYGTLYDSLVVTEAGDGFRLLTTFAPVVDADGRARNGYFIIGDPEPIAASALGGSRLDEQWNDVTEDIMVRARLRKSSGQ